MNKLAQLDVLTTVSMVPEPNVALMTGMSVIVFLLLLRRRRCD